MDSSRSAKMLNHHAYYIEDSLRRFEALAAALRAREDIAPHDPGFWARRYETFGVDEARQLIELASLKHTGACAIFFLGVASMTSEAQQALLKLFEEPQEGTVFILLVPHGMLMSTLRSRMLEWEGRKEFPKKMVWPARPSAETGDPRTFSEGIPGALHEAKQFLSWPYKKRSDWVASFLTDGEESTREKARSFLGELEHELLPRIKESREVREGLQDIQHFRRYLADRSPSLKVILEHFAATLPLLK